MHTRVAFSNSHGEIGCPKIAANQQITRLSTLHSSHDTSSDPTTTIIFQITVSIMFVSVCTCRWSQLGAALLPRFVEKENMCAYTRLCFGRILNCHQICGSKMHRNIYKQSNCFASVSVICFANNSNGHSSHSKSAMRFIDQMLNHQEISISFKETNEALTINIDRAT